MVCLGPLPENVQLPQPAAPAPRIVSPDGRTVAEAVTTTSTTAAATGEATASSQGRGTNGRRRRMSTDTLGSNFTVDEEWQAQHDVSRHASLRHDADVPIPPTPNSAERIDASELVHVPQLAERRYSWEEGSSL